MAKGIYVGVDNIARKVKKMYVGVDGVAHKVKKVYVGDENGKARLAWSGGNGGKLVLYNGSKIFLSEDDGMTYRQVFTKPEGATYSFGAMTYGNGKFVLICSGNSIPPIFTSSDGEHWSIASTPFSYVYSSSYAITFGNGVFLVAIKPTDVYTQDCTLYQSTDGVIWTVVRPSTWTRVIDLAFVNGTFFVLGDLPSSYANTSKYVQTSQDLVTWKSYSWYDDTPMVGFGINETCIYMTRYYSSSVGVTQRMSSLSSLPNLTVTETKNYYRNMYYAQGCFHNIMLVGNPGSSSYTYITNPFDESTYVSRSFPSGWSLSSYSGDVLFGENNMIFALLTRSSSVPVLFYSLDGINWIQTNVNVTGDLGLNVFLCRQIDGGKYI